MSVTGLTFLSSQRARNFEVRLTEKQAQHAGRWWAGVLGVGDWVIDIAVAPYLKHREWVGESNGACQWTLSQRRASISMADANDTPSDEDPIDMERVLVHELLHVVFAAWDDLTRGKGGFLKELDIVRDAACIEAPIENLAWLLVALRRNAPTFYFPWEKKRKAAKRKRKR